MKALETAIYSKLSGDTSLMTFITGVYNVAAPASARYPFLVFQKVADVTGYTFTSRVADEYLYQVRVIGSGLNKEPLNDALARVDALLTLQTLTVTGKRVDRVVREGDMPDVAQADEGEILLQVGATYRFYVI